MSSQPTLNATLNAKLYPRSKLFREHEQAKLNKQKPFPRSRLFRSECNRSECNRSESICNPVSVSDLFSLTEQMQNVTIKVEKADLSKMTEREKFWYQVNNRKGNEWYDEE
jgi:hypothetical protein